MTAKLELGICLFELRSGATQEIRPWNLLNEDGDEVFIRVPPERCIAVDVGES